MRRKKEEHIDEIKKTRRPVPCPVCGHRIMDASWNTRTQLITPTKNRYPDYYVKCGHCGAEIGVIKTE